MNSRLYVLDANAIVGLFEDRRGTAAKVDRLLEEATRQEQPLLMSAVNWGEVFYVVWRRHGEGQARAAARNFDELPVIVIPADRDRATRAAILKQKYNLAYADAFAAELAIERNARLVTADPEFAKIGKVLSIFPLPRHEK
jgi:predicted nucleic acid-binding protein